MPRAQWDGKAMLYADATGEFYADLDEAEDSLWEEEGGTLADLRLVICEPVYVWQLCADPFLDDLPDDGDLPDEVYEAIAEFNEAVKDIQLSWKPGKMALALDEQGGAQ